MGKLSQEELIEVEDEAIIALIKKQEAAGLKAVTDGEYRLAKNIGTSTAHMSRLMTGDIKDPRFELVCKIADALEIPIDELRKKDEQHAKLG